ncbi:MAG TPA: hypothetical protein VF775_05785 [Geobacteraceae bacterium]
MKRAIIALATLCGLYGAVRAEEQHRGVAQGSGHGNGNSAAESSLLREQGESREGASANAPARSSVLERERKRAIAIIDEALKRARERARREAEEARKKRVAEGKPHARKENGPERETAAP